MPSLQEAHVGKYSFLVLTNSVVGQDDEFNDWYTNRHLGDILRLDGFVAAQRFEVVDGAHDSTPPYRYMALYEIDADDLATARKSLAAASESGEMFVSPSMDSERVAAWYYEPLTERILSSD